MASRTLLMLLVLSIVAFKLSSIAATTTALPHEIRTLAEVLDLSSEDEVIATHRKLLQTSNAPRATFDVGGARVAVYNYADFSNAAASLSLYNSAAIVSNKLRLVSGLVNQRGQAIIANPLFIYNQNRAIAGVFGTKFTYKFSGNSRVCNPGTTPGTIPNCPGDGFTVSFSAVQPSAGLAGGALGYGGITPKSISIEFDVVQNPSDPPNNNHIGFNSGGTVTSVATAISPVDIVNGLAETTVWIEFWPTGGIGAPLQFTLRVFIATATQPKPTAAAFTTVADLGPILAAVGQDTLYVGFTAGTGLFTSTIEILKWGFFSSVINP